MLIEFFANYALFFAKALTVVIAIVAVIAALAQFKKEKAEEEGELKITSLNDYYQELANQIRFQFMDKKEIKAAQKKAEQEKSEADRPRLFVIDFDGDVEASAVDDLRHQISAVLQVADQADEVLIRLESSGGYVHAYGLAASQLARLREKSVRLVIAVDKVAASGGYMMACVANQLLAAPFAILGSVGVIGELPNFHDLLEKFDVHYEQHTAGKYKRSLTVFGENTEEDRQQFRKELSQTHELFKNHIQIMRPQLAVEEIATGETWYGVQAIERGLIDQVQTSDDYLLAHLETHHIMLLEIEKEDSLINRIKSRFFGKIQFPALFKSRIY